MRFQIWRRRNGYRDYWLWDTKTGVAYCFEDPCMNRVWKTNSVDTVIGFIRTNMEYIDTLDIKELRVKYPSWCDAVGKIPK